MNSNVKSATVAGLLGIFLGSVGAHDWYLGDKKKGTIHVCLAASGIIVSVIASAILPAALSWRTLITMAWLITILSGVAALIMAANGIWGVVEGIIILAQGDAGLVRKGYAVAQPMGYGNNYGNSGYNNYGQPMNNMGHGNNGENWNPNNNGNMNGNMNGNGPMNQNSGNSMNGMNGGNQNGR